MNPLGEMFEMRSATFPKVDRLLFLLDPGPFNQNPGKVHRVVLLPLFAAFSSLSKSRVEKPGRDD